jgi:hypothetical protein
MWLGAENESFNVVTWSIILVKEMWVSAWDYKITVSGLLFQGIFLCNKPNLLIISGNVWRGFIAVKNIIWRCSLYCSQFCNKWKTNHTGWIFQEIINIWNEVWTFELKFTDRMVEWSDTGANLLRLSFTQNWCKLNSAYICTRWFKYDRDKLWLVYTQIVPVIFEPPCNKVSKIKTENTTLSDLFL